jgi:hypothetical protein
VAGTGCPWRLRVLAVLAMAPGIALLCRTPAHAQVYFGQNKIQYTRFDWQILTTDHFQIYFYPEERWLAEVAAHSAEESYRDLCVKFQHHIFSKVPIIVYSAANYFSQTNVTTGLLPEGVAGFTEFFKGRVVLPFTGSYADFVRVLKHELVHVFTYSKLDYVLRTRQKLDGVAPPLWFTEGLAEHWSRPWASEADLVLRQMVLENRLVGIADMYRIDGSFYMYKVGESILKYWSERFGDLTIARLFDHWAEGKSFQQIVEITLGVPLAVLDEDWAYALRKQYYPEFKDLDLPSATAEAVSPDGFYLAPAPVCVPAGDSCRLEVVYLGNRLGYSALYGQKPGARQPHPLVRGGRSGRYELLHMFRAGIDSHASGKVAFSSKSNERDALFLYDMVRGRVTEQREFEPLVSIASPAFSPSGDQLAFSAAGKDGPLDLYLLDLDTQDPPLRLTHDLYRDSDPAFSPDGRRLVFASDRGRGGQEGFTNLFELELATGRIRALTDTTFSHSSPVFLGPDTLLFVSDRRGSFDVYALVGDTALYRVTHLSSGAFSPKVDGARGDLYFSAHTNFGYRVYRMALNSGAWSREPLESVAGDWVAWAADRALGTTTDSEMDVEKYRRNFSVDIAQSAISYDAVFGTIGGFQMAMSDVLGDDAYYFLLSNVANSSSQFLSSFNVAATYVSRRHRINYGWGVYHLYDEISNVVEGLYRERQAGGLVFASYPLSKFRRLELSNYTRYSKRDWLTPPHTREGVLTTSMLSLVYDNSVWHYTGPMEGIRTNISAGFTYNLTSGEVLNRIGWIDLRHYYRLGVQSAWATRLYAFLSGGEEPVRRYFGGSWDFRGFPRQSFYVRQILFASNEIRFPLIQRLDIAFPVGSLNFSRIQGALFFDAGALWDRGQPTWLGSYGFGWRVALGQLVVLRFDLAQITNFHTTPSGLNFEFFFGWNF